MPFKPRLLTSFLMVGALYCIGAALPAGAQTVYRCGAGKSVTYTERPCPGRIVTTDQAKVPVKLNRKEVDVRRAEENRVMAQAMRPRAGESAGQFETRRRRARLMPEDRAECTRLDTRMPVEEASMKNPDRAQVMAAQAALDQSRKRFSELGC